MSTEIKSIQILPQIVEPLLTWYHANARILPWREEATPYRVWVSEIMLQQTRVEAVLPYFERFMMTLPTISALARCEEDLLMKLWQGLGYYTRARNLKRTAKILVDRFDGKLPKDFTTLLTLPGIGRYTAAAISSIAYHHAHPAVDGNVLRVFSRLLLYAEDILKDRTKKEVESSLQPLYEEGAQSSALNQALMELGATICIPNGAPHCGHCPLEKLCLANAENCALDFPKKTAPKRRKIEKWTILHLSLDGHIALRKRPAKGLLANLWELPNYEGHLTLKEVMPLLSNRFDILAHEKLAPQKHIFSHIEWHMIGWKLTLKEKQTATILAESPTPYDPRAGEIAWITPRAIAENFSVPAAFQYYF